MKKLIMILTCLLLFTICSPVYGAEQIESSEIEYLDDGSYFETVITTESNSGMTTLSSKSVTKTKTSYYKNSNGTILWYVKITGTFHIWKRLFKMYKFFSNCRIKIWSMENHKQVCK